MTLGLVPSLPSSAPVVAGHEVATADVIINAADYPTLKDAFAAATDWRGHMDGFTCRLNLGEATYSGADIIDYSPGYFPELSINGVVGPDPAFSAIVVSKIAVTVTRDTEAEAALTGPFRNRVFDVKIALMDEGNNVLDFTTFYPVGSRVTLRAPSLSTINASLPLHCLIISPGIVHSVDSTGVTIRHLLDEFVATQILTAPAVTLPYTINEFVFGPRPTLDKWSTVFSNASTQNIAFAAPCLNIHTGSLYGIGGIWFDVDLESPETGNGRMSLRLDDISLSAYGDYPIVCHASGDYGLIVENPIKLHRVYADQFDFLLDNIFGPKVTDSDLSMSISGIYKSHAVDTDSMIRNLTGIAFGNDGVHGFGAASIFVGGHISGFDGNAGMASDMARIFSTPRSDGVAFTSTPAVGVPANTGATFYSY